jgi:hypothetical protein
MHMRSGTAVAAFALSLPSLVHAADAPIPVWAGVWRGTIGTLPVQACLQHQDYADFGAYFYLKHLDLIGLNPADTAAKPGTTTAWAENPNPGTDKPPPGPRWTAIAATGNTLTATWSDGRKTLPIQMTRVVGTDAELNACGDPVFIRPRATAPTVTATAATFEGVAYTVVTTDIGKHFKDYSLSTFRLNGTTPAIARVNAALMKRIPAKPEEADYIECAMGALGQNGNDGDHADETSPALITTHWLVSQRDVGGYCGGAHPDGTTIWTLWDLRTGTQVDLYSWLIPKGVTQKPADGYIDTTILPGLERLLDKGWKRDGPDCRGTEAFSWDPHLTRRGIAFMPRVSHAETACADDAVLSFATLAPFLNAQGKAGVASIIADLNAPRSPR